MRGVTEYAASRGDLNNKPGRLHAGVCREVPCKSPEAGVAQCAPGLERKGLSRGARAPAIPPWEGLGLFSPLSAGVQVSREEGYTRSLHGPVAPVGRGASSLFKTLSDFLSLSSTHVLSRSLSQHSQSRVCCGAAGLGLGHREVPNPQRCSVVSMGAQGSRGQRAHWRSGKASQRRCHLS